MHHKYKEEINAYWSHDTKYITQINASNYVLSVVWARETCDWQETLGLWLWREWWRWETSSTWRECV